jgi:hypothetical protein
LGLNDQLLRQSKYCTDTYVLVSMNAAADRARAEAERIANVNAAANADVPPVVQAPPVIPLVVPAAALLPAQVVIGPSRYPSGCSFLRLR